MDGGQVYEARCQPAALLGQGFVGEVVGCQRGV